MKLSTVMYHDKSFSNYKFVNNNKQSQGAFNLLVVGPQTMTLDTLMYHDKCSSKQIVNNNRQPQAIKTCKWCLRL